MCIIIDNSMNSLKPMKPSDYFGKKENTDIPFVGIGYGRDFTSFKPHNELYRGSEGTMDQFSVRDSIIDSAEERIVKNRSKVDKTVNIKNALVRKKEYVPKRYVKKIKSKK